MTKTCNKRCLRFSCGASHTEGLLFHGIVLLLATHIQDSLHQTVIVGFRGFKVERKGLRSDIFFGGDFCGSFAFLGGRGNNKSHLDDDLAGMCFFSIIFLFRHDGSGAEVSTSRLNEWSKSHVAWASEPNTAKMLS